MRFFVGLFAGALASLIFLHAADAATERVLYSFRGGPDGAGPEASLLNVDGTLYGTTYSGGSNNSGTVFSLDPKTGAEQVLHSFGGGSDGVGPGSGLIDVKGTLYGVTERGGVSGYGAVYRLNPESGSESVIYSFKGGSDGSDPAGAVINVKGVLYGTTAVDGAFVYCGTLFSIDPNTGAETVIHTFGNGDDGCEPTSNLMKINGLLLGTTSSGGKGYGTVFSFDPRSGKETVIYSFRRYRDGTYPYGGVIDESGTLYGTTSEGGTYGKKVLGKGTLYSLVLGTRTETVVHSFGKGSDGVNPIGSLANVNGVLYGTTGAGGANGNGAVFAADPSTGTETVVYSFGSGSDGQNPGSGVISVNGALYGTTYQGGAYGNGTVFAIEP